MSSLFVTIYVFVCCIPFFFIDRIGLINASAIAFFMFVLIGGVAFIFLRKKPALSLPASRPITTTPDYKIKIRG